MGAGKSFLIMNTEGPEGTLEKSPRLLFFFYFFFALLLRLSLPHIPSTPLDAFNSSLCFSFAALPLL